MDVLFNKHILPQMGISVAKAPSGGENGYQRYRFSSDRQPESPALPGEMVASIKFGQPGTAQG